MSPGRRPGGAHDKLNAAYLQGCIIGGVITGLAANSVFAGLIATALLVVIALISRDIRL